MSAEVSPELIATGSIIDLSHYCILFNVDSFKINFFIKETLKE